MATERLDIIVKITNASKAGSREVKKNLSGIDKAATTASKSVKALGASLLGITALFAAGRGFSDALKTFTEFDDAMRQAGAVANATEEEFAQLTATAKELGATTRFTAVQAAEGLKFLGLAGFEAAESIAALPNVLQLAAAGSLDLGQAADITTNILAAFGLEVENLSQVNDVLVKAFTSSNNNLIEISEAFKLVGPIAKGVGADFEDLIAAIGKLGDAGLKASIGGTSLRGTLAALFNPTREEAKLMEELSVRIGGVGLQVKDAEGNFVGFLKIIKQLEEAAFTGDEALKLFGLRAGPGVAALLNQGSESMQELIDKLREAGGTADEIATKMEAGIGGATRQLIAAFEALKIAFIDAFGDDLIVTIDGLTNSLRGLVNLIVELQEEGDFTGWGNAIVTVFDHISEAIEGATRRFIIFKSVFAGTVSAVLGDVEEMDKQLTRAVENINKLFSNVEVDLDVDPGTVVGTITDGMIKEFEKNAKESGPIGRGAKKVGDTVAKNIIDTVSMEANLKAGLIRLKAQLDKESAKLEQEYKNGIIDLEVYFDERETITKRQLGKELELLRAKLRAEEDLDKRELLGAGIFAKEQQLQTELIKLEQEKFQEFTKLEKERNLVLDQRLAKQLELERQEAKADKILNNIKVNNSLSASTRIQDIQNNELILLDKKHQEELIKFKKFTDDKVKIKELEAEQDIEREKKTTEQKKELRDQQLTNLQTVFGGVSQISQDLFELSGRQSKDLFQLSKAAAIATATVNIALGITKALAIGGPFGIATGALVAAAGAIQIAKISAQQFAEGGVIQGHSPHPKADNIPINATAGEGVLNVAAMKTFGSAPLHLMNKQAPTDQIIAAFANKNSRTNFNIPKVSKGLNFAEGGIIPQNTQQIIPQQKQTGINIVNIVDPTQISEYLNSSEGKNSVLNVISSKAKQVKRLLA